MSESIDRLRLETIRQAPNRGDQINDLRSVADRMKEKLDAYEAAQDIKGMEGMEGMFEARDEAVDTMAEAILLVLGIASSIDCDSYDLEDAAWDQLSKRRLNDD